MLNVLNVAVKAVIVDSTLKPLLNEEGVDKSTTMLSLLLDMVQTGEHKDNMFVLVEMS